MGRNSNARPVDTLAQIERAIADPGRRKPESIGRAIRRCLRRMQTMADYVDHALKHEFDVEHTLEHYLTMTVYLWGLPAAEVITDLAENHDKHLVAICRAIPARDRDAVLARVLNNLIER